MKDPLRRSAGFTMTELLAVIGVLGVLLALLVPVINRFGNQAGMTEDIANLRSLQVAWSLAAGDLKGVVPVGYVPIGEQGAYSKSQRHWPGRLAPYLDLHFPEEEFSVYLDGAGFPSKSVLRNSRLSDGMGRKSISYGINSEGLGTWYLGGFVGAQRLDGSRLGHSVRLMELGGKMILFAASNDGAWHLGNPIASNEAGRLLSEAPFQNCNIRAAWGGKAAFVRVDGSCFVNNVIPSAEECVLPNP